MMTCPKCNSTHWIKTTSQTVCMACGHREMTEERTGELAADYAEGEAKEDIL